MESWSYQRDGAIVGPASKEELAALFEAGEINRQTLVRSVSAGGEWKRYGEVQGLAPSRFPRTVKRLWPWFMLGTPLAAALIDVFLVQSTGNAFVEKNAALLSYAPTALNILAAILWLVLITLEFRKKAQKSVSGMAVWLIAAPLYLTFSWWTTVFISNRINVPLGFRVPSCQADLAKSQVKAAFERNAAKAGQTDVKAIALTETSQQWLAGRIRMCVGKLETNAQTYSVRYEIEDHGNRLFLRTMHGYFVSLLVK
ncbi:DUF4339 domain-containing protein [Methylocapsa acidiphila]|uniref:DUF4339 domain-containing protein n=1 Tax=Methylocapsa acidiphila TaxID=133552 RepID=UPI0003FDA4B2|nr:DUF4339 domain-containing protein [Methylocapsa acidiphila]